MAEFRMPSLGADMDAGEIVEWLVKPGDQVHKGDIVAVVDTAKAAVEVECFDTGVVEAILVPAGQRVDVGTVLATISAAGTGPRASEKPPPPRAAAPAPGGPQTPRKRSAKPRKTTQKPVPAAPSQESATPAPARYDSPLVRHLAEAAGLDGATIHGTGRGGLISRADVERLLAPANPAGAPAPAPVAPTDGRVRATPYARRLAAESGLDIAAIGGGRPDGVIRAADVRRAQEHGTATAPPATRPDREEPATAPAAPSVQPDRALAMRRAIGELMAKSKREIPHYYVSTTIDMARAVEWLTARNRELPVADRLVPAALLLKAAARAARAVPELNGFWIDDHFVPGPGVHLGVAVSLRGGGLIAPALHDAADLDLADLMAGLKDLVSRARAGRLRGSEMTDPTLTVTNLGDQGVEAVFGVIYPPQVALVGFGKVLQRPWAVDGLLGVRPLVVATLSADHRASDGATGARYLTAVDRLLQKPEEL